MCHRLMDNELLDNNSRLVLFTCPIVELLTTILSTVKSPAAILPSVLIVLDPDKFPQTDEI